jgi:energy-coupling factor transporter ATP-binding protein EcfA2
MTKGNEMVPAGPDIHLREDSRTSNREACTSAEALRFEDFGFQYRTQSAPTLHNICLRVGRGEKILIVGPSGSGKSTLAHCVNGLVPHAYKGDCSGTHLLDGQAAAKLGIFDISRKVGTVLQDADGQFVGLSAGEDIAFVLENDAVPREEMHERVARVAGLVAIERHLDKSPQDLSGGQKQRVSMAGVLIDEGDILLFDEPLANLDRLKRMADQTRHIGGLYAPLPELPDVLRRIGSASRPITLTQTRRWHLVEDSPWPWLAAFAMVLTLEWLLRRRAGLV